mmetsp:Transcript_51997/g.151085  ORF Transcript_51997/g.151085 Transcript_51997/m.151085 type:complete len:93 (-) Transcript_51997:401-679(-)
MPQHAGLPMDWSQQLPQRALSWGRLDELHPEVDANASRPLWSLEMASSIMPGLMDTHSASTRLPPLSSAVCCWLATAASIGDSEPPSVGWQW